MSGRRGSENGASTISRRGRPRGISSATLEVLRYEPLVSIADEHGRACVRHFFYQAVVAQLFDIGKDLSGYRKLQRAILKLRREGRIPYELVTDTTRWVRKPTTYSSLARALNETAAAYRRDLWEHSQYRVEVWCESESIAPTIYPVTELWRACHSCRVEASRRRRSPGPQQKRGATTYRACPLCSISVIMIPLDSRSDSRCAKSSHAWWWTRGTSSSGDASESPGSRSKPSISRDDPEEALLKTAERQFQRECDRLPWAEIWAAAAPC